MPNCQFCGAEFKEIRRNQMSCSAKCSMALHKKWEKDARKRRFTHCQECGKELTGCKNQKFCSDQCMRAKNREKMRKPQRTDKCIECGTEFTTGIKARRFCSRQCTTNYHNRERELKPNTFYDCVICGKHVEKYISPYSVRVGNAKNLYCSRQCKGKGLSAENHPLWNGGRQVIVGGYVLVYDPNATGAKRYTFEHRMAMEKHIGRKLKKEEVVHHINGNTSDNRIENLQLCANQSEHKKIHDPERERNELGQYLPVS